MFTTKFSAPHLKPFTYSEQQQEFELRLTYAEQVKTLVAKIYTAYSNIEYKLPSDAIIAQAAINICLYNLCGQDPTQQDDRIINNCYALEGEILNLDKRGSIIEGNLKSGYPAINLSFQAYINNLQEQHTNFMEFCNQDFVTDSFIKNIITNINSTVKDFIVNARTVLEIDCPRKIDITKLENKKIILEIAEYLCKIIQSKFEISNQISINAKAYKQEIQNLLEFLAKNFDLHTVRWPNTKQLYELFFKDAEQKVDATQTIPTPYKHRPYI